MIKLVKESPLFKGKKYACAVGGSDGLDLICTNSQVEDKKVSECVQEYIEEYVEQDEIDFVGTQDFLDLVIETLVNVYHIRPTVNHIEYDDIYSGSSRYDYVDINGNRYYITHYFDD
jgi:hypothetical protein